MVWHSIKECMTCHCVAMYIWVRKNIGLFFSILSLLAIIPCAHAAMGAGHMDANIINPLAMDIKTALKWCDENLESVKCDILKEEVESQEYDVLSVNFQ